MSPRGAGLAPGETTKTGWEPKTDRLGRRMYRASWKIAGVKVLGEIQRDIDPDAGWLWGIVFPEYKPTEWEDVPDSQDPGLKVRRPKSGIMPFPAVRLHGRYRGDVAALQAELDEKVRDKIAEVRWQRGGSLR